MEEKFELTYKDKRRLGTYSTDDYLWQYSSNPEVQIQMLKWEREDAARQATAELPGLVGVTGAMVVQAAVEILGVQESTVA